MLPIHNYFVHPSSFVDDDVTIGENTKIWYFCHLQPNAQIGRNCSLGQNVNIGPGVHVGHGVKIQNNVIVCEGVTLEDNVFIGPNVSFTNVLNPRAHIRRKHELKNTLIKHGVTIGAGCTILCGITIGHYAFIAAGAVVTKNIDPFSLVMGNPARHVGWMCECGYRLHESRCSHCNTTHANLNFSEEKSLRDN